MSLFITIIIFAGVIVINFIPAIVKRRINNYILFDMRRLKLYNCCSSGIKYNAAGAI